MMDLAKFSLFQWYIFVILIYTVMIICVKRVDGHYTRIAKFSVVLVTLGLAYLTALRSGIGDTGAYIGYFSQTANSFEQFRHQFTREGEWGFQVYLFVVKAIFGNNQVAFLTVSSLIILGGLMFFVFRTSSYPELCILVYMLGGSFVTGLNGVRQAIVASVFVANYRLIMEKKYIKYFILCLVLATFHRSSLILLPMIFILNFKAWRRGTWVLLLSAVGMYIAYPLFAETVTALLQGSYYDMYSNEILNSENGGANIIRVFVYLIPIILSFMYREQIEENFDEFGMCLNGTVLNLMFMLVASVRSWIFARFCIYFNPFSIVLLSESIKYSGKNKTILYSLCIFFYMLFFYFEMKSTIFLYS